MIIQHPVISTFWPCK